MTQPPVENFSGLSHASLCKSRNSKWSTSFLLLFILCCLVWPKKGSGLEIRMTGLWCWFKEHEILKGNEGSTFRSGYRGMIRPRPCPPGAHGLRTRKASKQFQTAEALLYSSSALSCRQWRTKRTLRGGVGKMMWISCHIWAFQRSQGKAIFHRDGRRGEMKGGCVTDNSNEVG